MSNPYTDAELLAELIARNEARPHSFHTHHALAGLRNALWAVQRRDVEEAFAPIEHPSARMARCLERAGQIQREDQAAGRPLTPTKEAMERAMAEAP